MDADDATIVPTYLPGKFGPASEPPSERPRDVLSVEIHLLSADKSSNPDLHALRNWARQGGQSLAAVMDRLCLWGSLELARHLRMILDSVFDMMSAAADAFDAVGDQELPPHLKQYPHFMAGLRLVLAITCKLAVSSQQQHSSLSDLVNEYIGEFMRFPALHRVLLPCILGATTAIRARFLDKNDNLGMASSSTEALVVMRLFKCMHYLVRIVMTSYAHDKMHRVGSDTAEDFDALCLHRLTLLLVTVQGLMTLRRPKFVALVMVHALRVYARVVTEVLSVFSHDELTLATAVRALVLSVWLPQAWPTCPRAVSVAKLLLLRELVNGPLFRIAALRKLLWDVVCRVVTLHLSLTDSPAETTLSVLLVGDISRCVQSPADTVAAADEVWRLSSVLPAAVSRTLALLQSPSGSCAVAPSRLIALCEGLVRDIVCDDDPAGGLSGGTGRAGHSASVRMRAPPVPAPGDRSKSILTFSSRSDALSFAALGAVSPHDAAIDGSDVYWPRLNHDDEDVAGAAVACTLGLVWMLTERQMRDFTRVFLETEADRTSFFTSLCALCTHARKPNFQESWFCMQLATLACVHRALNWLLVECRAGGHVHGSNIVDICTQVLDTCFWLCASPMLSETQLIPVKWAILRDHYPHLIPAFAATGTASWELLQGHARSTPAVFKLVAVCVELVCHPSPDVGRLARRVYHDALAAELAATGKLEQVERSSFDAVDSLVRTTPSAAVTSDVVLSLFTHDAVSAEVGAVPAVMTFLSELRQLYSMLGALSRWPATPAFEEERCAAAAALLQYLHKTNRNEMYSRYVDALIELHQSLDNQAEVGASWLLHAKGLDWSDTPLPAVVRRDPWPAESSASRLERVLTIVAHAFATAKCFEAACAALDRIIAYHRGTTMRFDRVADLLSLESHLYSQMFREERFFPTYFLVSYSGDGFPADLKRSSFIYRGRALERTAEFEARLLAKWPSAIRGGAAAAAGGDQITVALVSPVAASAVDGGLIAGPPGRAVTKFVRAATVNVTVDTFVRSRPIRKRVGAKSENEFLDLWVLKSVFTCRDAFPGTQRRADVTAVRDVELNPIEAAVDALNTKTVELQDMIETVTLSGAPVAPQAFTMAVRGVVDAAVNGGVKRYEPFFDGSYAVSAPEIAADVASSEAKRMVHVMLRQAILDQLHVLERAIDVHATKCDLSMQPLHALLVERLASLRPMVEGLIRMMH